MIKIGNKSFFQTVCLSRFSVYKNNRSLFSTENNTTTASDSENVNKTSESKTDAKEEEPIQLNEDQIREKILENAMKHVPSLGFTNNAISQGITCLKV
jgi:ubiquinone biosynthesis protein COQ9